MASKFYKEDRRGSYRKLVNLVQILRGNAFFHTIIVHGPAAV